MTKNVIIKPRRDTDVTDVQLFALIRESYGVWMEHGLVSEWQDFTPEDFGKFRRFAQKTSIFVALDAETGELLGTHSLKAYRKTGVVNGSALAVSPKAQHIGIATRLLEFEVERAKRAGYRCFKGRTGVEATWSVNWHLKNGYRIVGYKHLEKENYPSYEFRKQLVPSLLWDNAFFCRCVYLASYVVTKLTKDSNGNLSAMGRMVKYIKTNYLYIIYSMMITFHNF